jgi:hypothetical protein
MRILILHCDCCFWTCFQIIFRSPSDENRNIFIFYHTTHHHKPLELELDETNHFCKLIAELAHINKRTNKQTKTTQRYTTIRTDGVPIRFIQITLLILRIWMNAAILKTKNHKVTFIVSKKQMIFALFKREQQIETSKARKRPVPTNAEHALIFFRCRGTQSKIQFSINCDCDNTLIYIV